MSVRPAVETDWPRLADLGEMFFAEKNLPGTFNREVWISNWNNFTEQGYGHVLVAELEDGTLAGAIGGFHTPDVSHGDLTASEAFWFVDPAHRTVGIRLLKHWIDHARESGCRRLTMVHLCDFSSKRIGRIYERLGMKPLEISYLMEL